MKLSRMFSAIMLCGLLSSCTIGDQIEDSFNNDIEYTTEGGGCLSCLEAATDLRHIVLDNQLCDGVKPDLDNLKDCSKVIPACQTWSQGDSPMNENCFNTIFGTNICQGDLFICAAK